MLWTSPLRSSVCSYFTHLAGRNPGGVRWELTAEEAISAIHSCQLSFYLLRNGRVFDIVIASYDEKLYLKCADDDQIPFRLLSLPVFVPFGLPLLG